MSKKMKLALLALLGFSTACSTVKNSAKSESEPTDATEQVEQAAPKIRVLYGVRPPQPLEEQSASEAPEQQTEAEKSEK